VVVCYDLIPILFPQFYAARDVAVFTQYFRAALRFTDRFICISQRTAADLARFAEIEGGGGQDILGDIRGERLGADAAQRGGSGAALPAGLSAGRFVLFVSTIEPRKNHALLLKMWHRLAAGEAGGTGGFKLVFAGRRGWMVDDVLRALKDDPVFVRDIVHLPEVDDALLAALYAQTAFCVYPSLYEGFGLPVIEAHAHGKPVIASAAGALPEAAGGLAPCLDPNDVDAWTAAVARWINDPAALAAQAERVRAEFSWPTWPQAVARIIAVARER
jgi:glycosyltransferase involved in cell wall biosynthesis